MNETASHPRRNGIFAFELDFADSLRCIPMAVRFKLDACGVKLTLPQWLLFTAADRDRILNSPCSTDDEIAAYRRDLVDLIEARSGEDARMTAVQSHPVWMETRYVPKPVRMQAWSVGVAPPTLEQWAVLAPLQRFALVKLTRPGHRNLNFLPAMREFGLAPAGMPQRVESRHEH